MRGVFRRIAFGGLIEDLARDLLIAARRVMRRIGRDPSYLDPVAVFNAIGWPAR
jgi:hypothetical protein